MRLFPFPYSSHTLSMVPSHILLPTWILPQCARRIMKEYGEIVVGYGESDEFSFVFSRSAHAYGRRAAKLQTNIVSLFTSYYVFLWSDFFPDTKLQYPPCFDARTVMYPSYQTIRDYLAWRQVDTHINNLYNTTFWRLVQSGMTSQSVEM